MSSYFENRQAGLDHASADSLAYFEGQNKAAKRQADQRALDNYDEEQKRRHGQNEQSAPNSVFKTPLAEKVPEWLYAIFAIAGAIGAIVALQLIKPSIFNSITTLNASWVEWVAFPLAAVAGFTVGGTLVNVVANVIETLINLLLSLISIAVVMGLIYLGSVAFGLAPWPEFLSL